jgi:hypothetical protein
VNFIILSAIAFYQLFNKQISINEHEVKRSIRVNARDIRHVTGVRRIKGERKCESGNVNNMDMQSSMY